MDLDPIVYYYVTAWLAGSYVGWILGKLVNWIIRKRRQAKCDHQWEWVPLDFNGRNRHGGGSA